MTTQNKINIGVMLNDKSLTQWQYDTLAKALEIPEVEIKVFIVNATASKSRRLKKNISFRILQRWALRNGASRKVSCRQYEEITFDKDILRVEVLQKGFRDHFSDSDVELLSSYELDVVVRFGFRVLSGKILDVPKFGIWSFHHGDEREYRGSPAGFWEVYAQANTSGVILQRLTEELDSGYIIERAVVKTELCSYGKNADNLFKLGVPLLKKALLRLVCTCYYEVKAETKAPIYIKPSIVEVVRYILIIKWLGLFRKIRSLFHYEDWRIGIGRAKIDDVLKGDTPKAETTIPHSKKYFLADPFWKSEQEIIVEKFTYKDGVGRIGTLKLKNGNLRDNFNDIRFLGYDDIHFSYPQIIHLDGEEVLLPEMSETGIQMLFNLDGVVATEKVRIHNNSIIDATILFYGEKYWLFCSDQKLGPNQSLSIFYSNKVDGKWLPHQQNPLKIDITGSRMAGEFINHEGELYRLAQDCSKTYGGGISVYKVLRLDEIDYREEFVTKLEPPLGKHGMHTLNIKEGRAVFDMKVERLSISILWMKIKRRAKRNWSSYHIERVRQPELEHR